MSDAGDNNKEKNKKSKDKDILLTMQTWNMSDTDKPAPPAAATTAEETPKAKKQRGLGRGLGALFEDEEGVYPQPDPMGQTPGLQRRTAGIDQLEPGSFQPRRDFDEAGLQELAESIRAHGILQPILVRAKKDNENRFEIIAGERRWRAAQKAQLHEVPIIIGTFEDQTALEIGLIENLQREDLNPIDEARGYLRLSEEFGHTQEQIAAKLGKSRSHVANMMRLLNLSPHIKRLITESKLTAGHARALAAMSSENAEELADQIISKGLSVRDAEALAAEYIVMEKKGEKNKKPTGRGKPTKDVDTLALEEEVGNQLGMKVGISTRATGGGSLKIKFKTLDQLDEVLHRLSHNPGRKQGRVD